MSTNSDDNKKEYIAFKYNPLPSIAPSILGVLGWQSLIPADLHL